MVGKLTYGKRQWETLDQEMRGLISPVDSLSRKITTLIDADTNAFNDYMVIITQKITFSFLPVAQCRIYILS